MKFGGVYHLFGVGKSFGAFFVQFGPLVHVRNELSLSDKFRAALRDAKPFTSNTRYGIKDEGVAQAAIAYQVGYAVRAFHAAARAESASADPRRNGSTAIYVGAAPKYLMGLAYGQIISNGGVRPATRSSGTATKWRSTWPASRATPRSAATGASGTAWVRTSEPFSTGEISSSASA